MPTAHNRAELGDFAATVIMPGDPLRAQRIAHHILDDIRLVTDVRSMLGFTGTYRGRPLSVMGSGMGQPSIAIYATELYSQYGVENIIRVGTCGGISKDVHVGDTVVALGAHTDSNFNQQRIPGVYFSAIGSYPLIAGAMSAAGPSETIHVGTIVSRDHFYDVAPEQNRLLADYGVLGVEMESAALYGIAAQYGKQALSVLTVSDHLFGDLDGMPPEQREGHFEQALHLALAAAESAAA